MNDLLLLPLKIILIGLDLLITLVTFGWVGAVQKLFAKPKLRSVPVADDESHRVDPRFKGKLVTTPVPGAETLYDLAKDAFTNYATVPCMGTRPFLGYEPGSKNKIKLFDGKKVSWRSYAEVDAAVHKFGAALKEIGVETAPPTTDLEMVKNGSRIAIFENTCAEWMIAAMGSFSQSVTVVTVYATLGMDAVVEAVQKNACPAIVCNRSNVAKLLEKADEMKTLKCIVYTNDLITPDEKKSPLSVEAKGNSIKVMSMDEFIASGDVEKFPPTPPKPDTCAVVMYTSGSTGKPKGVVITHRQIVATIGAGKYALHIHRGEDVYLAYLPLAHIMELMAEFVFLTAGCSLAYADPKSLSSTGAKPAGALETYSPTMMVAVPKIWDVIKKGLLQKVGQSSPVAQCLVHTALEWRAFCVPYGLDTPLFKALVFKKLCAAVGGKLRRGISGGGPLNAEVQVFIRTAFCMVLNQGYGLTETNAGLSFQDEDDLNTGIAGMPVASCEVKLVSCPDVRDKAGLPYLNTDRFDVDGNPVFGRGEVWVRGANISLGYYMEPEKTAEAYKEGGWFCTGDIGQFMGGDGSIKIVDRKKNLVKLKGGEYIALEQMEMVYGNSTFVDAVNGGITCYGDGDMDRPVALMQLNKAVTMAWAKKNSIKDANDWEAVQKSKELYTAIMNDLKLQHAKSDLSHLERLVAVALICDSPWTPENGCLTAANKLQRRAVVETHKDAFDEVKKKGIFD